MLTNVNEIPLVLAVWLLHDQYDHVNEPNYVSATALMKPLRHVILPSRLNSVRDVDLESFISRALGHSLHDSIEKSWKDGHASSLKKLGYPQGLIDRVRINPTDEELEADDTIIPIYMEQRGFRQVTINGVTYTIGGKFDLVAEGIINDYKSTSAYTWVFGGKDDDYQLQMSIYRWIDAARKRRKILEDYGVINFIFTDWQRAQARQKADYPQSRIQAKEIPLLPLKETQDWIEHKLSQIAKYRNASEADIPECTDDELWRSDPVFKYYSDPTKMAGRSTRNFDNLADANSFKAEKSKGIVISVPGEPKRCGYCDAYEICRQKDRYFST